MVQGRLEGNLFTLWVDGEFTKGVVNKPELTGAVEAEVFAMTGTAVRCDVKVGKAPPAPVSAQERDNLAAST